MLLFALIIEAYWTYRLAMVKILQKYGTLKKFDFLYHKSGPDIGKPRGYCFVTYENKHVS